MESPNLTREEKLHVILCGPLARTERALRRRGDVEIRRDDNLNLLAAMSRGDYDCDMIIVEAPYGQGLYSMTYPVGEIRRCPVWMVADPPDKVIWKEINCQLGEVPEKRKAARERAIAMGPPKNEILIISDTPQRRSDLTGWTREIYAAWGMPLPALNVPEDVKTYLRELRWPCAPPEAVVIAMAGVASLNTAEQIRRLYPKTGLIWSCDLDFALQAFERRADHYFPLKEASRENLESGLDQWQSRIKPHKERGNEA